MLVYEINTRCWLRELSEQSGASITLAQVPDTEFQDWERLGFTHLWLMGVWTAGPRARAAAVAVNDLQRAYGSDFQPVSEEDIVASPYAIAKYRVPESLGGENGLKLFRERLNQRGLKLLLDFVPNHVGLDHPWLREQPDLFVQSPGEADGCFEQETTLGYRFLAHGRDPFFPPWSDTAQLDYRNPATRKAMIAQLLEIAARCDGVRCDMAMLLLNEVFEKTWKDLPPHLPVSGDASRGEFWGEAIQVVRRKYPGLMFVAEAYWGLESRLPSLGFDFAYDKDLYDAMVGTDPTRVQTRLLASSQEFLATGVHFLENHDERRIASILPFEKHRAAALLMLGLPGLRMLHEGQLAGATVRTPVQLVRRPIEPVRPEIQRMYEDILEATRRAGVGAGNCELLRPLSVSPAFQPPKHIVILKWNSGPDFSLIAVNLGQMSESCLVPVPRIRFTLTTNFGRGSVQPVDRQQISSTGTSREDQAMISEKQEFLRIDLEAHSGLILIA